MTTSIDAGAGRAVANGTVVNATVGGFGGEAVTESESIRAHLGFTGQLHPTRPWFAELGFLFPATVVVTLFGEDDARYRIDTCPMLPPTSRVHPTNWTAVTTVRTVNGVVSYQHRNSALNAQRFYRAVQIP